MACSLVRAAAVLFFLSGLTVPAAPLAAQSEAPEWELGFGIGFRSQTFYVIDQGAFWVPAPVAYFHGVATGVMIEPFAGYTRIRTRATETDGGRTVTSVTSQLQLGIGFRFLSDSGENGRSYWGPRLGLRRVRADESDVPPGEGESYLDFTGAVVMGAEYFVASGLTMGGEVGLEYRRQGDPQVTVDEWSSTVEVVIELRFRWYFQEEEEPPGADDG